MSLVYHYWASRTDLDKRRWHAVALCAALFLFHYIWFSGWYVEDAAISFSFARNAAHGEGFVAYPGGERVEGFSNPTWTLLLTACEWVGCTSWVAAKLLGALFGLACLPLAMLWAQALMPNRRDLLPALAPLLLAISPQFVLWTASGLENSLLCLEMALGSVLLLREIRTPRATPWSGFVWCLVAISRPEGPLYAASAGALGALLFLSQNGLRALIRWLIRWVALSAFPFFLWHTWRYLYFGWEWPNTYYAKLDNVDKFLPWSWKKRGWWYLRGYALASGMGFVGWVLLLGHTGARGLRRFVAPALFVLLGILLIPGLDYLQSIVGGFTWKEPEWWVTIRVVALVMTATLLPLIGLTRPGWRGRWFAWYSMLTVVFFAHYVGGDWMRGYRWASFFAVPLSVLLADALAVLSDALGHWVRPSLQSRMKRLAWGVPVGFLFCISAVYTIYLINNTETSPFDVRRRALYMQEVQKRLHLDRVALLEVDMGAHMWWSGFEVVDMAGLVDVPMGHHKWDKPFISEYVYQERRPEFAHVHGSWATKTKMQTHPEWRTDYLSIAPYPISTRSFHGGNHIRKDLIVAESWSGTTGRVVDFQGGVRLNGWDVPAPQVAPGQGVYLEVGWQKTRSTRPFRAIFFLAGPDGILSKEIPPAYDWLRFSRWHRDDIILGFHTFHLPNDLPHGLYDLGFVVIGDNDTGVRIPTAKPKEAKTHDFRYARGEVRWAGAIEITDLDTVVKSADSALEQGIQAANNGNCTQAQSYWKTARRHLLPTHPWQDTASPSIKTALSICWAEAASDAGATETGVQAIQTARRWDHRNPTVIAAGNALADAFQEQSATALSTDDAYTALRHALIADPSRSWVRRKAETLRDERLLAPSADASPPIP